MKKVYLFLMVFLCLFGNHSSAQAVDSLGLSAKDIPSKYYTKVDRKINSVDEQLTKKSIKYLTKFQKQEAKLQRKMQRIDPEFVIDSATEKYQALSQKIKNNAAPLTKIAGGEYNSYLDSLGTSLSFLKQFDGISGKVKQPLSSLNQLQSKLQESEKIKAFIAERKSQLTKMLSKYTKLPAGLKGQYARLSKTAYYYSAQLKEYKEMLKDPEKIERQTLSLLNKLPAFQTFIQKNSQLASLFPLPGDVGSAQGLADLQTRGSVQSLIQQRIASGGPNAQAQITANLASAQAEMGKLKDKLNEFTGGSGGDVNMPDFNPNSQKIKPLLERLEYSADVQFDKSSNLLPSTANVGLGIGYKLNDKGTAGMGLSYKLGMGTIQHISFSSQAIGLRSYIDWKIKKQYYISGGYEMNYNSVFKNVEQLKGYNAWQRSALVGLSKRYKISKKVSGEMKLLYDFLANSHIPVSQPILFRLGYKF